jgi:Flp pilus assembly protein TadG
MAQAATHAAIRGNRPTGRRGAVIVEAAFVLPVCFLILLSLFDFGRLTMTRHLLDNAARSGARLAVTSASTLATSDIQNCVTQCLAGQSLANMTIQVYQVDPASGTNLGPWTNTPLGSYIAVEIDGNYTPILPSLSLIPNPLPTTVKVMMLCEAN